MNALGNDKVAEFINDNFVATYLKVGTFQIVNGQKVGGNVASYFCLHDGSVVHAVPGKTDADTLLNEARWAHETRKSALTRASNLVTGNVEMTKYKMFLRLAHEERFFADVQQNLAQKALGGRQRQVNNPPAGRVLTNIFPQHLPQQTQAHWVLANNSLAKIDQVYPIVWERILREKLSGLPVTKR